MVSHQVYNATDTKSIALHCSKIKIQFATQSISCHDAPFPFG